MLGRHFSGQFRFWALVFEVFGCVRMLSRNSSGVLRLDGLIRFGEPGNWVWVLGLWTIWG